MLQYRGVSAPRQQRPVIRKGGGFFVVPRSFAAIIVVGSIIERISLSRISRLLRDVRLAAFVERLAIPIAIAFVRDVVSLRPIVPRPMPRAVIDAIVAIKRLLRICRSPVRASQRKGTYDNKNSDDHEILLPAFDPGLFYDLGEDEAWHLGKAFRRGCNHSCGRRGQIGSEPSETSGPKACDVFKKAIAKIAAMHLSAS